MAIEVPFNLAGTVSGVSSAASTVTAPIAAAFKAINNPLAFLGLTTDRKIGEFSPDIVVEETGHDALEVTSHPVEIGSPISDHAFKHPPEARITACWSSSGAGPGYVRQMYASLLELQESYKPVTVTTGKRAYKNMLIEGLTQRTDVTSEYSLIVEFSLKQIRMAMVMTTTVPLNPAKVANPASTTSVEKTSPQQAIPATPAQEKSLMLRIADQIPR